MFLCRPWPEWLCCSAFLFRKIERNLPCYLTWPLVVARGYQFQFGYIVLINPQGILSPQLRSTARGAWPRRGRGMLLCLEF